MIDENELVLTKWSSRNKKWYEDKGYSYTGMFTEFYARVRDLTPGSSALIHMTCDYCGKVLKIKYNTYRIKHKLSPIDSCNKCKGNKTRKTTLKGRKDYEWDKLTSFCNKMGYELVTKKDDYTDVRMYIEYICSKHGLQRSQLNNMVVGHGCKGCKYESQNDATRKKPDDVEMFINSHNGNTLLNKEDYQSVFKNNLKIKCSCGREYTTSYRNFSLGQQRCFVCSNKKSSAEWHIYNLLTDAGIEFVNEKTFPDLKDKASLRFDFYLQDYNLVIEYDGEGHYLEVFYRNMEGDAKERLTNAQRRDRIKDKYCKDHGINILRIPYWEFDNIDDIIFDTLNELEEQRKIV